MKHYPESQIYTSVAFFTKPFCCLCYWEILSFVVMLRYYVLYTFPESVKAALSVMFSFYSVVILLYTLLLVSLVYAVHSLNYELFILCFSCMTNFISSSILRASTLWGGISG